MVLLLILAIYPTSMGFLPVNLGEQNDILIRDQFTMCHIMGKESVKHYETEKDEYGKLPYHVMYQCLRIPEKKDV